MSEELSNALKTTSRNAIVLAAKLMKSNGSTGRDGITGNYAATKIAGATRGLLTNEVAGFIRRSLIMKDYEPFGDEWKRYMMRQSKAIIFAAFPEINSCEPRSKREIVALAAQIGKARKIAASSTREAVAWMNENKGTAFLPAFVETNSWKPGTVAILGPAVKT